MMMNKMQSLEGSSWKTYLFPSLLFIFVLVFSWFALWIGDDITYLYSFKDDSVITSFSQIIPSQIEHYYTVNGRTPAHFLCQLFIPLWGQTAFAIANGAVCVLLLYFMAGLSGIKKNDYLSLGILTAFILLGFRTKFTPTCQIGFPWMFCIVAGYLLLLERFSDESENRISSWNLLWAVPFSFIAGWSQEALVIGVGAALGIKVLCNIRKVSWQQWILLVVFAIGAALLCFSPATLGRTGEKHGGGAFLSASLMSLAKLGYYLRITYLLVICTLYLLVSRKAKFKDLFVGNGFYWIVWAVMFLFNIYIGVYGNRQLFGMEFAGMIILLNYIRTFFSKDAGYCRAVGISLAVLSVMVLLTGVSNARFLVHHRSVYNEIVAAFEKSEDGTVYHDFPADDVTFIDTYPSDVFSWYAMNTMARKLGSEKNLNVLPSICKDLKDGNYWERTAEGTVTIVVDKENVPEKVEISRTLFGKDLSSQTVSLDEPVFEDDGHIVALVYEKLPLVKYGAVRFHE